MTPNQIPGSDHGAIPEFTLGDRLRKAREYSGMDMQTLADAIDVHRQSIARYEQGIATPKRHVILSWSMVTGVTLDWIETGVVSGSISTYDEQTSRTTDSEFKPVLGFDARGITRISLP